MKTALLLTTLALGGWGLFGCSTATKVDAIDDSEIVACSECEVVWVRHGRRHPKSGIKTYHLKQKMTCPNCDKQARSYLKDGKIVLHDCPGCKATPKAGKSGPRSAPKR